MAGDRRGPPLSLPKGICETLAVRGHCGPLIHILRAEEQRSGAAHRVPHQIGAVIVDIEFTAHDPKHVHHVLFAEFRKVWGLGSLRRPARARSRSAFIRTAPCSRSRPSPPAWTAARDDDGRAVPPLSVVTHRTHHDVSALFRKIQRIASRLRSMIGTGINIVSAEMSRQAGSPGWLLVSWIVTGLLTIAAALSYGELAAMMPHAGGQYVYLREAWSPLCGFLYGWTLFLVIQTGTAAAVGIGFARYLGVLWPAVPKGTI